MQIKQYNDKERQHIVSKRIQYKTSITTLLLAFLAIVPVSAVSAEATLFTSDNGESAISHTLPTTNLAASTSGLSDQRVLNAKQHSGARNNISKSELEAATAIPVPAALWLFGTALFALFTIARRRS